MTEFKYRSDRAGEPQVYWHPENQHKGMALVIISTGTKNRQSISVEAARLLHDRLGEFLKPLGNEAAQPVMMICKRVADGKCSNPWMVSSCIHNKPHKKTNICSDAIPGGCPRCVEVKP